MPMNLYDILRVRTDATSDEIGEGFSRLLEKYAGKTDEDSVNAIKFARMAFETLSDEQQRLMYDQKLACNNQPTSDAGSIQVVPARITAADPISNDDFSAWREDDQSTVKAGLGSVLQAIAPRNRLIRNALFCLLGVLGIFFYIQHFGGSKQDRQRAAVVKKIETEGRESANKLVELQNKQIAEARKLLSYSLKDAESAQIRDVAYCKYGGSDILFGYVNAKNAYGAYIGFKEFVIDFSDGSIQYSSEDREHVYPRCD